MKRFTISLFLLFSLGFFLFSETVRVAYVNHQGYQEGTEDTYKTGFGYEYLQKISYYTGWEYEYVYGSFEESIARIINNEVDIMGNVSYTEERAKEMFFSTAEQGTETFYL